MSKDIPVSADYTHAVEVDIGRRKGIFINARLDQKRGELGVKEFNKQRPELIKEFEQRWEQLQKAKATIRELEDRSSREIMKWAPLEKAHLVRLEAEGWKKEVIENTINARKREFDHVQGIVKRRIIASKYDEKADFRARISNPATRKEALERFLRHHVHKDVFLLEAIEILWSELDKLKRR